MMTDSYTTLLKMIAEGKTDAEVAAATGWSEEAVLTLRQEIEYSLLVH